MKKILLIVGALTITNITLSCKKDGETAIGSKTDIKVDNSTDADAIIDFNNKYIDEYQKKSKFVNEVISYANAALEKSKGGNVLIMPLVIPPILSVNGKVAEVPKSFGKIKDNIDTSFKTYTSTYDVINATYDALKSHMAAEDYKDDKGAKVEIMVKEIQENSTQFLDSGDNILLVMNDAVDKAEEITLKDHPIKDYIIASKKVMKELDQSYNVLEKQLVANKYDDVATQKAYDSLEKALTSNRNKKFETKDSAFQYKGNSYDSFNKSISNYLDSMRKLMRDAKASGKISEADLNTIDSRYDSAISSYNTFIN